jgi:hypothetical protein
VLNFNADHELKNGRIVTARAIALEGLAAARDLRRTSEVVAANAILARATSASGDRLGAITCLRKLASDCVAATLGARARAAIETAACEIGISLAGSKDGTRALPSAG